MYAHDKLLCTDAFICLFFISFLSCIFNSLHTHTQILYVHTYLYFACKHYKINKTQIIHTRTHTHQYVVIHGVIIEILDLLLFSKDRYYRPLTLAPRKCSAWSALDVLNRVGAHDCTIIRIYTVHAYAIQQVILNIRIIPLYKYMVSIYLWHNFMLTLVYIRIYIYADCPRERTCCRCPCLRLKDERRRKSMHTYVPAVNITRLSRYQVTVIKIRF